MQHLGHGRPGHISSLLRQTGVSQIAASVLRVGHIHIGDNVHNAAIGFLRQALVLAAVASFHVEDGDMQTLCTNDAQTAVGIAQHQNGVRLDSDHQFVALSDNIAHGLAQICAYGIHVDLRVCQLQIMEEHTVQVIVVVLAGVSQNNIKVLTSLVDDGRQADNFRAGADDNQQLQFAIVPKRHVTIINHCFSISNQIRSVIQSISCLTSLAGTPAITQLGFVYFFNKRDAAPTIQFSAIEVPFKIVTPVPIQT